MGSSPTVPTMDIHWNRRTYTESQFTQAWNASRSVAECARSLDLSVYGSTYVTLRNTAKVLGLTEDHMMGQGWNSGNSPVTSKKPIEFYLQKGVPHGSNFKSRLISEGLLNGECSAPYCPVPNPTIHPFTGESTELKLALDHIDGDHSNNVLDNLRLLCYHCHGETETWTSKNRKKPKKLAVDPKSICSCGQKKGKTAVKCKSCDVLLRKSLAR